MQGQPGAVAHCSSWTEDTPGRTGQLLLVGTGPGQLDK